MLLKGSKNISYLDRYLSKLEREAGDDLVMLLEYGADCFQTYELKLLLERVKSQGKQILFLKKMGIMIFSISFFSVGISIYSFISDQLFFGYLFLAFIPVYLGLGAFLFHRFYKNNLTIDKTSYLKNLLENEISYRQNKAIF